MKVAGCTIGSLYGQDGVKCSTVNKTTIVFQPWDVNELQSVFVVDTWTNNRGLVSVRVSSLVLSTAAMNNGRPVQYRKE